MADIFFTNALFREIILPFLLVFVVLFAVLQKTGVLGKGKTQIDAITSLIIALIFVGFTKAVGITVDLMGFLAVVIVIIFVFLLIYGFIGGDKFDDIFGKKLKITLGIIAGIAIVVALLVITHSWNNVWTFITSDSMGANVVFIIIVIAVILFVLFGPKGGSGKEGGGKKEDE